MDFILGILFGWWMWPMLFIAALFAESTDSHTWAGFLAFLTMIAFAGAFNLWSFSITTLGLFLIGYLGVGSGHSVFRWYRYTDIKTEEFNDLLNPGEYEIKAYVNATNYREQLDRITYWILMWPVSSLAHFFRDALDLVRKMVATWFSNVFDKITNRARDKANVDLSKYV
jgi:hypothetical protein